MQAASIARIAPRPASRTEKADVFTALLLTDVHIHFLARIDRCILLSKAEYYGQHPQIHLLLALIRKLDLW